MRDRSGAPKLQQQHTDQAPLRKPERKSEFKGFWGVRLVELLAFKRCFAARLGLSAGCTSETALI